MVKEVDGTNNQVYGVAVTKQLRCLARDALARRGVVSPAMGASSFQKTNVEFASP